MTTYSDRRLSSSFICVVPARAGSKGLRNKNTQRISGKTLIERAVDLGLAASLPVILTTDIPNAIPANYQSLVTLRHRPKHLCTDTATMNDVILDVIRHFELKANLILLQPTSPFRKIEHLQDAIRRYTDTCPTLLLTAKIADSSVLKHVVQIGENFHPICDAKYMFENRQHLPAVFQPNGAIYIFNASSFVSNGFDVSNLEIIEMDDESSLDIDDLSDLAIAREIKE